MFLLVVGTILTGHTQQILCERVLTAPAGQRAFNVSGLLQVRPDSLRLLGDFRAAFSVTNPVSLATRTSLGSWQATTCDTLASRTVFSSPQASSSLAQPNRHGQVLVANSLIGTPPYNDSIRVVLTLFGRNGQRRWSRVLPPAFRQEAAGGGRRARSAGWRLLRVRGQLPGPNRQHGAVTLAAQLSLWHAALTYLHPARHPWPCTSLGAYPR